MNEDIQFAWDIEPLEGAKALPVCEAGESAAVEEDLVRVEFEDDVSKADRLDCLAAASIGALSSILNVFWQKELDIEEARGWGAEKVGAVVVEAAKSQGFKPKADAEDDILRAAIRFLEEKFPLASDKVTAEMGGGLQHHLRDFEHHPSPLGLFFSVLTQFTRQAYGTDTAGSFMVVDLPADAAIGKNFNEKIAFGTVRWLFHLVSDMAGSSNTPGAGTGIPGPILSFLKELSALPFFGNYNIDYKGSEIAFSQYISKLFNGTAIRDEDGKPIRFDLRAEVGVIDQALSQVKSVIANECIVRGYYFVSRLLTEIKQKEIASIADIGMVDPTRVLPHNNRALKRMMSISSSVFVAVNVGNAAIRAAAKSGGSKSAFAKGVLVRLNYFGIARMALALKDDAPYIAEDLKELIEERFGDYVRFTQDFSLLELSPRTARVLNSIEAFALENDISATKNAKQQKIKTEWAKRWREKVALEMGVDEGAYFLSEENVCSELRALGGEGATTSWEALFVLELAQFKPYVPFEKHDGKQDKSPKYGVDYLRKVLPTKQDVLTSKEIKSILASRDRYERKLTGSTAKAFVGGAAVVVVTAATGGAAYAFAPLIAPMIAGEAVAGLSGAALTSASLAAIGGGSLAAGGLGMAGGTAILAGGGALLGLAGSGTVALAANVGALPEQYVLGECCKLLAFADVRTHEDGGLFARGASSRLERLLASVKAEIEAEKAKGKGASKKEIKNRKAICSYLEKTISELDDLEASGTPALPDAPKLGAVRN